MHANHVHNYAQWGCGVQHWEMTLITQNVKHRWSLMGGGCLQEVRLYWVKILHHLHRITAKDLPHVLDVLLR